MAQHLEYRGRGIRRQFGAVLRNPRSHIHFLIALFLIQTLLTVLFLSTSTDYATAKSMIVDRYDYDIEFRSLTQPQYAALFNQCKTEPGEDEPALPYASIRYEKNPDGTYDAFVSLRGADIGDAAEEFLADYLPEMEKINSVTYSFSPRFRYEADYASAIRRFAVLSTLAVTVLSVFLLIELYRMRLNHETFDFGIYMTCGASFGRLFRVAATELLTLGALTLLPAVALGIGISSLLFAARGAKLSPSILSVALIPVFSVLIELASVYLPMRRLSRRMPVELLRARDNASLVTSPRTSFRLIGKKFPDHLERISLWRYRRYIAWILFSAVFFPILFVCTSSFAEIWQTRAEAPAPDFTVSLHPKVVDADILNENISDLADEISGIDGVAFAEPEPIRQSAAGLNFIMLMNDRQTHRGTSLGTLTFTGRSSTALDSAFRYATNRYNHVALDESAVRAMTARYEKIDGDPTSVLRDDHTVMISEAMNNSTAFHFEVGDTVYLCTTAAVAVSVYDFDEMRNLQMAMERGTYSFEPFTVGAVIRDRASDARLTVGMNFAVYKRLTGASPCRTSLDVYLSDLPDFETWDDVSTAVYECANEYYNCTVEDRHVFFDRYLNSFKNLEGRLTLLAVSFLIMAPLVCFFSQRVFYGKRDAEFGMLRAMGATRGEIRRAYLYSGALTAALTFALALPLGLLTDFLMFKLWNEWLPAGAFITSVVLTYAVPWGKIAVMLALALLCGLLPPITAYASRARREHRSPETLMQGE